MVQNQALGTESNSHEIWKELHRFMSRLYSQFPDPKYCSRKLKSLCLWWWWYSRDCRGNCAMFTPIFDLDHHGMRSISGRRTGMHSSILTIRKQNQPLCNPTCLIQPQILQARLLVWQAPPPLVLIAPHLYRTLALCVKTMKPGQGGAIFTAECSHAFHFRCISSKICKVCGAKWNDTPFEDLQSVIADTKQSIIDGVHIKIYPEVPAVERSISLENFTILIHLKAPANANSQSTLQNSCAPVDLVTVLNVSGSMTGTKLALLKQAMAFVIQNLGSSDRLSVAAFSSTAYCPFPLHKMTDSGKQKALKAINSLRAGGGTNIAEGLTRGAKVFDERIETNHVSSIMLLSDGQDNYLSNVRDNYGVCRTDYQSLLPLSVWGDGNQIPIHAFGFGADHDAALMHFVSETSGGTFSFIEADGVIQDAFAQCIGGLLSVVVQTLRLSINCVHPGVHLGCLKAGSYSTQLMTDGRSGSVVVGDLYADEEKNFLISVSVPAADDLSEETLLVKVHCTYSDPISKEILTLEGKDVNIQRPNVVYERVVSLEVDRQKNRVRAAEAMCDARAAAEKGDFPSAMSILEDVRNLTLETPSARAGDKLCAALDAELKQVQTRMASRRTYEESGRAYALSAMSSHLTERAATRDNFSDDDDDMGCAAPYQTKAMAEMVARSKEFSKH